MKQYSFLALFILMILLNSGCKEKNQKNLTYPDNHTQNNTIETNYQYYFNNSISTISQLPWKRIDIDTVNDEYNQWIEATLFFNEDEWAKVEGDDLITPITASFETNSNRFLAQSRFKIGDDISPIIFHDSADFNFDEGYRSITIGNTQMKFGCLNEISDLEFDNILIAREKKQKQLLPKKLNGCTIQSIRIINIE